MHAYGNKMNQKSKNKLPFTIISYLGLYIYIFLHIFSFISKVQNTTSFPNNHRLLLARILKFNSKKIKPQDWMWHSILQL